MRTRYACFLLLLLLIAGCGGECKTSADCQKKTCYTAVCTDKACDYEPLSNCCGNGRCEAGENSCTCPGDCSPCMGQSGDYLTKFCNAQQECVTGLDPDTVRISSITSGSINDASGYYEIDTAFNQPFNIDEDRFFLTISLKEFKRNIIDAEIKKISIIGQTQDRQMITLGEKELNRQMWNPGQEISTEIYLDPKTTDKEAKLRYASVTVTLSYRQAGTAAAVERQSTFSFKLPNIEFVYVSPGLPRSCPPIEEWDDGNNATHSICSSETSYFVEHIPIPGVCGNFRCEPRSGEQRCTCPIDCGPCQGDAGAYLEMMCNEAQECVAYLKVDTVLTPQTIFRELNAGAFTIQATVIYDTPFNIKESVFNMDFKTTKIDPRATEITLIEVRLLEGSALLFQKELNTVFQDSSIQTTSPITSGVDTPESERSLTLKVWYSYLDSQTESTRYGDQTITIGKLLLLNPD